MAFRNRWAPYVPVSQRRANAALETKNLLKKGQTLRPIHIRSRAIATSFWGLAWCNNLANYADWSNRLPRGRTYARNGSIVHLQIETGKITALVNGSSLYEIEISIDTLSKKAWLAIRNDCAQQVSSMLDLMRGKLPDELLARLTDLRQGIFPSPKEIKLRCSCPDQATLCKHVAATLYGVGHLLDSEPELFFKMRGVDQTELIADAMTTEATGNAMGLDQQSDFAGEDLSAIFGIDLITTPISPRSVKKARSGNTSTSKVSTRSSSVAKPKSTKKSKPNQKQIENKATSKQVPEAMVDKQKVKPAKKVAQPGTVISRKKPSA
jgi:uncharacterized Zn finger protein